ncbi:glutathione S-transferase family protein [Roseococcus sp. YIM B11640]|uniref:glutathione S-transferase family protein n=1 Tax=Roseococcus sp. YIM B11640 TaxID=3133973 RepID=UPI003C7A916B
MIHILGRANSTNVWKPLWVLEELGLPYERSDAGMEHGVVDTPEYRALNPNGRIPSLRHDGIELWESNSICRYLCLLAGGDAKGLYPAAPAARASVDRWLDWQLSTLSPAERDLFWGMVRTPAEKRDMKAVAAAVTNSARCWAILEDRLKDGRLYIEGDTLTLADIILGCFARRWFGEEVRVPGMPEFPRLAAWFARIGERPGFRRFVAPKLF